MRGVLQRTWAIVSCPLYGYIGRELTKQANLFPEPWKTHALLCLNCKLLTTTQTKIIVCFEKEHGIIASAWISIPDMVFLTGWDSCAFLSHIHVIRRKRGCGLGKKLLQIACNYVESQNIDNILIAANDTHLKMNFYGNMGFKSIEDDPWLMCYKCRQEDRKYVESISNVYKKTIRAVSPHDLATIQTICFHQHWACNGIVQLKEAVEQEEDFASYFVDENLFDQYLIKSEFKNSKFVSWIRKTNDGQLVQCILCHNENQKQIKNIAKKNKTFIEKLFVHCSLND